LNELAYGLNDLGITGGVIFSNFNGVGIFQMDGEQKALASGWLREHH
jgi:hypothetical protein